MNKQNLLRITVQLENRRGAKLAACNPGGENCVRQSEYVILRVTECSHVL